MGENISRRTFCSAAISACVSLAAMARAVAVDKKTSSADAPRGKTGRPAKAQSVKKRGAEKIFPPSSAGYETFKSLCTGCMACVAACEGSVIKPNAAASSVDMDFDSGYCVYVCTSCTDACPTGALKPVSRNEKLTLKIALAVLEEDLCENVKNSNGMCALCAEVCPAAALGMVLVKSTSDATIPDIEPNICVGCGMCAYVCPSKAIKMIPVERGSLRRKTAKETGTQSF